MLKTLIRIPRATSVIKKVDPYTYVFFDLGPTGLSGSTFDPRSPRLSLLLVKRIQTITIGGILKSKDQLYRGQSISVSVLELTPA